MPHAEYPDLAQGAYAAYGQSTGGRNFRGEPMPDWDDLPDGIRIAWQAAAQDVVNTWAAQERADPIEYGEIQISRHLGRGTVVDEAPEYAKAHFAMLAATHIDLRLDTGGIRIAEQVEYAITGYDPADQYLTLRLVMDARPGKKDDPQRDKDTDDPPADMADPYRRREAMAVWLTANGVDPNDVPLHADVTVDTDGGGRRIIRYEAFQRDGDGNILVADGGTSAAVEERTTPLTAEPPAELAPYVDPPPTR